MSAEPLLPADAPSGESDPYLWLEPTDGPAAIDWARARNAETTARYAQSTRFQQIQQGILDVLDSDARIPYVYKAGAHVYNFWQDKQHAKGLWRRTTLADYQQAQPTWETVLDVDALAAAEGENWVWEGADWLHPGYSRCLISLSRGGADATVVREFDPLRKAFVEGGFIVPEAKSSASWRDEDHLYVGTDFGPGSMTESSYPRLVKQWRRGTPLADAVLVYEAAQEDLAASAWRDATPGFERDFVHRAIDFYDSETWLRRADGTLAKVDVPDDASVDVTREWLLIEPRSDWTVGARTHRAGSLLAARFEAYMAGGANSPCCSSPPTPAPWRNIRGRAITSSST